MKHYDVIIIGAGASGLMCALTAGQRGRKVLVLDSSNKVGKKILMSGGGRCNFTNRTVTPANYICANPHFTKSALSRYTPWDFIALVEKHGIPYEEREHEQLFCLDSARDILDMLLAECALGDVTIKTHTTISAVRAQENNAYQVLSNQGDFSAPSLVIATGGLSIPTLGSSGFGYELAQQFGLKVLPRRAGLVPFTVTGELKGLCERLSGLALPVEMSCEGASFREALLFTHRGLSGPVALQVSNYWKEGQPVWINLLPELDLPAWLIAQKQAQPKSLLRTVLGGQLAKSLVAELQRLFWDDVNEKCMADLPNKRLQEIGEQLQLWLIKPAGTEGYRTAEVTLGGVDTDAISSKTMECKTQRGLYFIGEVLDVSGHLGGFNFQWAWASGHCAGQVV